MSASGRRYVLKQIVLDIGGDKVHDTGEIPPIPCHVHDCCGNFPAIVLNIIINVKSQVVT